MGFSFVDIPWIDKPLEEKTQARLLIPDRNWDGYTNPYALREGVFPPDSFADLNKLLDWFQGPTS
ncbi:MAG: hypothetical protein M1514_00270 [Patescibacteria group bacterium]|nr:hypothetical protein [Patescibacteria group bacterium]